MIILLSKIWRKVLLLVGKRKYYSNSWQKKLNGWERAQWFEHLVINFKKWQVYNFHNDLKSYMESHQKNGNKSIIRALDPTKMHRDSIYSKHENKTFCKSENKIKYLYLESAGIYAGHRAAKTFRDILLQWSQLFLKYRIWNWCKILKCCHFIFASMCF